MAGILIYSENTNLALELLAAARTISESLKLAINAVAINDAKHPTVNHTKSKLLVIMSMVIDVIPMATHSNIEAVVPMITSSFLNNKLSVKMF